MTWRFYLDDLQISEPIGFDDIVMEVKRDDNWHGVFFEASTSDIKFYGAAAEYLRDKKKTLGLKASVIFRAESKCEDELTFVEVLKGKLNFRRYKESCGTDCLVTLNVEQENCIMTMRNRYDQKVEMEKGVAFDDFSVLAPYDKLNFDLELPAKDLDVRLEGSVSLDGDITALTNMPNEGPILIRPIYQREIFNSIKTGQVSEVVNPYEVDAVNGGQPVSPQLLYEDNPLCFSGDFQYEIRVKGNYTIEALAGPNGIGQIDIQFKEYKPEDLNDITGSNSTGTVLENYSIRTSSDPFVDDHSFTYDVSWSGTLQPKDGYGYYAFIRFGTTPNDFNIDNTFDPETYIKISNNKSCPPTTSKVSAINETLSRVSEAITNNCLKVKSDYYGRTDSQPYASTVDGCGSLRTLTSGLHIRKDANARFFASLKELYEGLKAIDNIGMGIDPNPNIPGFDWLRIEDVSYFYQDVELLRMPSVPIMEIAVEESGHYSLIKVGFKKWEVENVNGLDEPNSNKEYRTSLSAVSNTLDITSNLVSGSYAIEITRQQSFAVSGGADTKFDNDIFIICVDRGAYGFEVEQDNIGGVYASASNVYSPETLYNWRIRPYYNLMRWFKSIVNSYPDLVGSDHKLYFASGTGNFLAEGELIDGPYDAQGCKLENGPKAENDNLSIGDFADPAKGTPIWRPEVINLKYPMSVKDYRAIKDNPYGYISVECGTSGVFLQGFVKQLQYRPTKGECELQLKLRWQ